MKTPGRFFRRLNLALLAAIVAPLCAKAQNLMIGFNRVDCPAQSDTMVSVPFMKHPIEASSVVGAVPDLSVTGKATIACTGKKDWAGDALKDKHYLRFTSGSKAGHWFDIVGSTASGITIDLNGGDATGLAAGDRFLVVEYWTLDTLFPSGAQTTVHVSAGNLGYQRGTSIIIPNVTDQGIDLPADAVYFLTAAGWKQSVTGFPAAGATILPPGLPFIIRHPRGVAATKFEPEGRVLRTDDSVGLARGASRQDNAVAVLRPVAVALKDSGLDEAAFLSSPTHAPSDRQDELLVFDNSATGFNKRPSSIYYKVAGAWFREDGKGQDNPAADDNEALAASGGLVVRKAKGATGMVTWNNRPTY